MAQLEFDEETSKQIEAAYAARDVVRRRELVRKALAARRADRVIDVGCGPGFYVAELLEEVGPEGAVLGIDSSESMLALAAERCRGRENVEFERPMRPRSPSPTPPLTPRSASRCSSTWPTSPRPSARCCGPCGPAAGS